jgi:hypothetical protein
MVGRGSAFAAHEPIARGELARGLALAAGAPQRVPPSASYVDVPPSLADWPYVESVSGRSARVTLMDGMGDRFRHGVAVRRIDAAVGAVRAAGLASEADARAGETLGLDDEHRIPDRLKGYAAVAIERGLIDAGSAFDPTGKLTRLHAASMLLRVLELRAAPPPAPAAGSDGVSRKEPGRERAPRELRAPAGRTQHPGARGR